MFEFGSGGDLRVEGETLVSTEAICAVPAAVSDGVEKSVCIGESVCTLEFEWEISGSVSRELTTTAGGFSVSNSAAVKVTAMSGSIVSAANSARAIAPVFGGNCSMVVRRGLAATCAAERAGDFADG